MTRRPADVARSGDQFVITLFTSSMPMPLKLAAGVALPGLSLFRSRTVDDGRERFRLHLGYFESRASAEEVLAKLRAAYPSALITREPGAGSGSLDDTINTAFTLMRGATARLVTAEDRPQPAPAPTGPPPAAAAPPAPTLSPGEVASALAPQRYAVQLDWSLSPIRPASIPRLGIFRAYNLYVVSVLRQGSPKHGLRLGFFKHLDGARQVADYVRHQFPHASVVPVSYREYTRASELTRREASAAQVRSTDAAAAAEAAAPAAPETRPAVPAGVSNAAAAVVTREELLALLGANKLEVDSRPGAEPTSTAEERLRHSRRLPRSVRHW